MNLVPGQKYIVRNSYLLEYSGLSVEGLHRFIYRKDSDYLINESEISTHIKDPKEYVNKVFARRGSDGSFIYFKIEELNEKSCQFRIKWEDGKEAWTEISIVSGLDKDISKLNEIDRLLIFGV